ncbi:MAG: MptD family putative ECF transporter S component [Christensenellales bacterium]|nr:MptD family putative ECF transporter S component [Christensenellales bacterium]
MNLLPIWFFWDTYSEFALASGMEQSYIDSYVRYYSSPGWVAFILVFATACGW